MRSRKTIKSQFVFPTLYLNSQELLDFMANQDAIKCTHAVADKNSLVGIEVEVENIRRPEKIVPSPFWNMTEDGSLRNSGREFVSVPVRAGMIEWALRWLDKTLPADREFSPRTSVHVHLNVRTLTGQQLLSFLKVYLVFENALFQFVGNGRKDNIHCVPLHGTSIIRSFNQNFPSRLRNLLWMKYTALNFCPVSTQGTVEFRHMHGTLDIDKLMTWINLILRIKLYCYQHSETEIDRQIMRLNTTSNYALFAQDVFGGDLASYLGVHDYTACRGMEAGVYEVKKAISSSKAVVALRENISSENMGAIRESLGAFLKVEPQPATSNLTFATINLPTAVDAVLSVDEVDEDEEE